MGQGEIGCCLIQHEVIADIIKLVILRFGSHIWKDSKKYPKESYPYLLNLMVRLQLAINIDQILLIKWLTDTFLKASFVTTSATGIPMALLGMPVPEALCVGVGISVIASAVSYNIQKKKALRDNPYSYLLSIQNYW